MKRASFGSITRQDKSTWRLRWWADTPTGRRRVSETVHGTRRDAEHRLAEIHVEVGAERGGTVTVGQAWTRWFEPDCLQRLEEGSLAPNTWNNAKSQWRRNIAPRWANVPCTQVRPLEVQEWLLGMTWANARLSKIVFGQVMSMAAMFEACDSNPLALKYRLPKKEAVGSTDVLDLNELRDVYATVKGTPIEAAFILAAFGSCRVGESLGVRCSEVALVESCGVAVATAKVDRQVDRDGKVVSRLKNEQSRRSVVVPGKLGVRLAYLAARNADAGLEWMSDDGTCEPLSQQRLHWRWVDLSKSTAAEGVPFKNLRNSWATFTHWLLGIDPLMVDKMMGHSTGTVLAKHYDRPDVELFVEAVAKAYKEHPFAEDWDI